MQGEEITNQDQDWPADRHLLLEIILQPQSIKMQPMALNRQSEIRKNGLLATALLETWDLQALISP